MAKHTINKQDAYEIMSEVRGARVRQLIEKLIKIDQAWRMRQISNSLFKLSCELEGFGNYGYPLLQLSAITKEMAQGFRGGSFDGSYIAEKASKLLDGCNAIPRT